MSTGRGLILLDPYPRTLQQCFAPGVRRRLETLGDVSWHDGPPRDDETVDALLPRTIAIVGQTPLPAERLERAPRLQAVLNVEGNFLQNVDYDMCARRGIQVLCAAPVFGPPVAELALGLALAAARDIVEADRELRERREALFGGANERAFLLAGKEVGLVGFGNLARSLLPLLTALGCATMGYDPWREPAELRAAGVEPVDLDDLCRRARVLFVLVPPTTENGGLLGRRQLALLAPGSVVVLVSRAPVVDWEALLDESTSGRLRVAIDVFPEEPIPTGERARDTPNTILSAHRGGNVPEIWPRIGEMVADDLEAILAGRPPFRMQAFDPATVQRLRSRPIAPWRAG
jgi:phosphoglycerate dehydrogenase-like enzyme